MKTLRAMAVLAVVMVSLVLPAYGQVSSSDTVEQRKARIVENLKYEFPQLRQYSIVVNELNPSSIEGLDEGTFIINSQQAQQFIVTADDTKLFLIGADAIDASRSSAELAVLMEEERGALKEAAKERHAALQQVIEGWPVRGNPDAPVTIIEFSDFECPYCSRGYQTMEQLLEKYPEDVKFVYLHFPLTSIHPWAEPAAVAAVCASQQDEDAFWTLHDSYFENQDDIEVDNLLEKSRGFLSGSSIDLDTWASCSGDTESPAYQAALATVENAVTIGRRFGVSGTPGFFVNGHFLNGAQPLTLFEQLIQEAKADLP